MKLARLTVTCPEVLGALELSFLDEEGQVRPLTLIYGGPGAGKTLLLSAIANTRPGNVVAMGVRPADVACRVRTEWLLGMDEPDRPKPLVLSSPNASVVDPNERRESAFVDRLAREGGFVFVCLSALRWFSKAPLILTSPERGIARYDVRTHHPLEDAARNDLVRDVKQALAYGAIARVLPALSESPGRDAPPKRISAAQLGEAMRVVVGNLTRGFGLEYAELDPHSLEPCFRDRGGRAYRFDHLPTALKNAIAFGALPLMALWGAYPGMDPRRAQGVVVLDQLELHQDPSVASVLLDVLTEALPEVQWIVTTRSPELLALRANDETFALRRLSEHGQISVHSGRDSLVH